MSTVLAARWWRWSRTQTWNRLRLVYFLLLSASMLAELVAVALVLWFQLGAVLLPATAVMLLLVLPALGDGFVQRVILPAPLVARWIVSLRGWPLLGALAGLGLWLLAVALIWRINWIDGAVIGALSLATVGAIHRDRLGLGAWRRRGRAR